MEHVPCTCSGENSVERVFSSTESLVIWHLATRLDAMFETEQLPTCVVLKVLSTSSEKKVFLTCVVSKFAHVVTSTDGLDICT